MITDPRLKEVVIKRGGHFGTTFDVDEWEIPYDIVEYYYVFFRGSHIATFWICNNFPDSMQLHSPMDVVLIEYIISQMKVREFKKQEVK